MIILEGIVLKERSVGEQDKFIDILTKEKGVIEISVKGAKKINGKTGSSSQLFAYSRFCLNQRGERLFLNSAEPIHIFYDLRSSLSKISLASYFSDVIRFCINPETHSSEVLRLFLNTLHYLEKGLRDEKLLKAVFELRLMSEIGYMPDILACRGCGSFEPEELFFSISDGRFFCKDCFTGSSDSDFIRMKTPVLSAVRHIVLVDFDRLFNFRVSDRVMEKLSVSAESYLISHLERNFQTLEFYKSLTPHLFK